MANCKYFVANQPGDRVNCANCRRWNGKRCQDENRLRELYEESRAFRFFDRLMREDKGVNGPL